MNQEKKTENCDIKMKSSEYEIFTRHKPQP